MKLPTSNHRLPLLFPWLLILLLAGLPPVSGEEEHGGADTSPAAPSAQDTHPPAPISALKQNAPPQESTSPAGQPASPTEDFEQMRQQYRQDRTGVRARLGMCRQGRCMHGGHHGRHHRLRQGWQDQDHLAPEQSE